MVIRAVEDAVDVANARDAVDILDVALLQLRQRGAMYRRFCEYYDGEQPLTYVTEKYRDAFAKMVAAYAENMCPAVVDSFADRLIVLGFEVQGGGEANTEAAAPAWELWNANRMDRKSGEVHQEVSKNGDAYVIVWPNPETGEVRFYPQKAEWMTVKYGEEDAVAWAAKWWLEDDKTGRLNLYFPDVIRKYRTINKVRSGSGFATKGSAMEEMTADAITNPYGRVPVFHFANNSGVGEFGKSDLKDVLPIQDALNKATADMLVGMEFQAFPQRWATGLTPEFDSTGRPKPLFVPGVDRVWTSQDKDVHFGQFEAASLEGMLKAQDKFLLAIARVSGVPTHYMMINPSDFPSGESLKTAEARFVAKIRDRQVAFGNVWEDAVAFALEVQGAAPSTQLSVLWQDASPRSDKEMAETANLKKTFGISDQQLQREVGYSEEQIKAMAAEKDAAAEASTERQARLFAAGNPGV